MANLFNLQHNLMMALMVVVGKNVFFADNTIGGKTVEELLVKYCKERDYGMKMSPKVEIKCAALKNDAGVIGAASLVM